VHIYDTTGWHGLPPKTRFVFPNDLAELDRAYSVNRTNAAGAEKDAFN
jgi:hypothetical protein